MYFPFDLMSELYLFILEEVINKDWNYCNKLLLSHKLLKILHTVKNILSTAVPLQYN